MLMIGNICIKKECDTSSHRFRILILDLLHQEHQTGSILLTNMKTPCCETVKSSYGCTTSHQSRTFAHKCCNKADRCDSEIYCAYRRFRHFLNCSKKNPGSNGPESITQHSGHINSPSASGPAGNNKAASAAALHANVLSTPPWWGQHDREIQAPLTHCFSPDDNY